MKNAFYFTLKAVFFLKMFKLLSWFFGHIENSLTRKIRLISKFTTSQPDKQTNVIHILQYHQYLKKQRQSVRYNMKNIVLEKSCTKCGGETIPSLFSKKSKLGISLDQ